MLTNLLIFFIGVLSIFTALAASAILCVLILEPGHTIPMFFLSRPKGEIYIGSLGLVNLFRTGNKAQKTAATE